MGSYYGHMGIWHDLSVVIIIRIFIYPNPT